MCFRGIFGFLLSLFSLCFFMLLQASSQPAISPSLEVGRIPVLQFTADNQKYDAIEYSDKLDSAHNWQPLKIIGPNATSGSFVDDNNIETNRFYRFRPKPGADQEGGAKGEAVITSGFLTSIKILNGGSGYKNTPIVNISGGGGSGARAVAEVLNGAVVKISILNAGIGYTNIPYINIDSLSAANSRLFISYSAKLSIRAAVGSTNTVEWKSLNSFNSDWLLYTNLTQTQETVVLYLDPTNLVNAQYRVSAPINQDVVWIPEGMVVIPETKFTMGDTRVSQSLPLRQVQVSGYAIDKYEISNGIWDDVVSWAQKNGYDLPMISSHKINFPADQISWFDAIKWCNARSEMNGMPPAYSVYVGSPKTKQVYRNGDREEPVLERLAGYRLPTEAEWECAARGGNKTDLHPSIASYNYPAFLNSGMSGYKSPVAVGSYPANKYGVYDMLGNVYEWCWDWYSNYGSEFQIDPIGSTSGTEKVLRGGNYAIDPSLCVVVRTGAKVSPNAKFGGFRSAIKINQPKFNQNVLWQQPSVGAELTLTVGEKYPLVIFLNSRLTPALNILSGPAYLDGNTLVSTGVGDIVLSVTHPGNSMFASVRHDVVIHVKESASIMAPMVGIPSGNFAMGSARVSGATPIHNVVLGGVKIDKNEVSKELWTEIRNWAFKNGYFDLPLGKSFAGKNQPIHSVNWFDVIKWCNARSENSGIIPAYYTDQALTKIFKNGDGPVFVKWDVGFRLPTEAEWEYAAKGGLSENLFPWQSDPISNIFGSTSLANYSASGFGSTVAVGSYPPNGYGLNDMAGNLWEWCWDWLGAYSSPSQNNPKGPSSGTQRVIRGGAWAYNYDLMYVSRRNNRYIDSPPQFADECTGFRCVLSGN